MTDPIRASRSIAGFGGPSADMDPTPLTAEEERVRGLDAELRAAPRLVENVSHQDMYDALGEDADDDLYELADRMYLFLTRRRHAPRYDLTLDADREQYRRLEEAARDYLDAAAEPVLSWVIESQEARAEGRPNREVERAERVTQARIALRAALSPEEEGS